MTRQAKRKRSTSRDGGFSLIEILVVIVIIIILVGIAIGVGFHLRTKGQIESTKATMDVLMNAIERYRELQGSYPATGDSTALFKALNGVDECQKLINSLQSGVINKESDGNVYIYDGFGEVIKYSDSGGLGGRPRLTSGGPDGDIGTADDNIYSDKK